MSRYPARHLAAASLAIAGTGALACLPFRAHPLGAAGFALFEAALVGGCADWFAVTALFRHPLGQRWVPHTAIIAHNRDRIVDNLVRLVDERLLSRNSLQTLLLEVPLLERLLENLNREALLDGATDLLLGQARAQLGSLDPARIRGLLDELVIQPLDSRDARALWHTLRTSLLDDARLEALLAEGLAGGSRLAHSQEVHTAIRGLLQTLVDKLIAANPLLGMARAFLNLDRMSELAAEGLQERLERASRDGQDPLRLALVRALDARSPAAPVCSTVERLRGLVLESRQTLADSLARRIRDGLAEWLQQPARREELRALLARELERLEQDPERRGRVEVWLRSHLLELAERHHHRIGELVRRNLQHLDGRELSEELEERVGGDLQWIRVNGAVVGGLVGLALHGLLSIAGLSS